ncbi:hypothetical protein MKEN_00628200 [Mycena kentingensis (nom. inval.)]|nr:hypothetical protein MKEN_00628200 [Mycena kentingensis (nom. inval.)]
MFWNIPHSQACSLLVHSHIPTLHTRVGRGETQSRGLDAYGPRLNLIIALVNLNTKSTVFPIFTAVFLAVQRLESASSSMRSAVQARRTMGLVSGLAHKSERFRLAPFKHNSALACPEASPPPPLPDAPFFFDAMANVVEYRPPISAELPPSPRLVLHHRLPSPPEAPLKTTKLALTAFATGYMAWFDADQNRILAENATHERVSALPITAAKATCYLKSESSMATTALHRRLTCGVQHIKQVISALEWHRVQKQHLYPDFPEARIPLRTDVCIKTIESAASHNEVQRIKNSHSLKAVGTHADTYNSNELQQIVQNLMRAHNPSDIWRANRDRAMMLIQLTIAFRGDSSRGLLWSDIYTHDVPFIAKGLNEKVPALAIIANQAKHNQIGRVEEHAAFRHRIVELCPIGALGFLYFSIFHVLNIPVPDFAPDFNDPKFGDWGRRDWYNLHVFSTSKDGTKEMTYGAQRSRVKKAHNENDVKISRVTHAGRGYTATNARTWSESRGSEGSWSLERRRVVWRLRPRLSIEAMLGAAMFNSREPQSHFLSRGALVPPASVSTLRSHSLLPSPQWIPAGSLLAARYLLPTPAVVATPRPLPSAHMPLLPLPGLDIRADNTAFILTMLTNAANNNLTTRFGNPRRERAHWELQCYVWACAESCAEVMAANDFLYFSLLRVICNRLPAVSGNGDGDFNTCNRMLATMTNLRNGTAVQTPVQPASSSSTALTAAPQRTPPPPFCCGSAAGHLEPLAASFPNLAGGQLNTSIPLLSSASGGRWYFLRLGTSSLKSATFPFVPRHVTASNPAPIAALSGGVSLGPSRPAIERLAPIAPHSASDEEMPLAPPTSLTSDSPPPLASVSTSSDDSVLRESVPAPVVSAAKSESLDNIVNGKPIASGPASVAASATKADNSDTAISPLYSTPPPALAVPGPSATAPSTFVFGTADASPVSEDLSFRSSSQSTAISHATVPGSVFGGLHAAAPGGSVFPLPVVAVYSTKGFAAGPGAQSTAGSSTTGDSSSDAGPRPRNGGAFTSPAKYCIRTGPKSTPKLKRTLLERIGPSRSGPSTDSVGTFQACLVFGSPIRPAEWVPEFYPHARDIALRNFLTTLVWFRTVIVQDAALLYANYPSLPIFAWAPFNSNEYRAFAMTARETIATAEAEVELSLKNLPVHVAHTFQAVTTRLVLEQKLEHERVEARHAEILTLAPPASAPPPTVARNVMFPINDAAPLPLQPSPPPQLCPPPPPPFDNIPLAPAFEPLFDAAPALFDLDLDWDAELPRLDSLPPTAGNNLVPASAPAPPTPTFPTSVLNSFDSGADPDQHLREAEWARLVAKFPEARLRAHRWEWLTAGPKANTLLPYYDYAPVTKICEIWEEYHSGLNGCLPTRQLESEWKASWRRNNRSLKNAYSLRNRVVTLVEQLAAERKWTTDRVLRFLREEYDEASPPVYTTVRSFCEGLDTSSAKLRGEDARRGRMLELAQLLGLRRWANWQRSEDFRRIIEVYEAGSLGTRLSSLQKLSFRNWRSSEKHILELFFYQLCNLQRSSATFIFVFDGPGRPKVKRGVRVRKHSRNLLKNVKQLIKAFGYYVHDAPGEAEAELAYLNKKGNIDAIITTDSDVFVFGGLCVLQMNGSKVDEQVSLFDATRRNLPRSASTAAVSFWWLSWQVVITMKTDVVASEPSVLLHIPEAVLAVATRDVASIATNFTIRPDVVQAIRNTTNSSHLPTVVVRSSVRADILLDRDKIEVEDTDDEDFLSAHRRLGLQGVVDLSGLE